MATLKIMPESEHAKAIAEAEREYSERLDETTTQVIRTFPRMFRTIKHGLRTADADPTLAELGEQQMWVLYMLNHGPQLTSELARKFNVAMPTMTRTVDALVNRGYVLREHDAEDRRKIFLRLTEAGAQVAGTAHAAFRRGVAHFLSPLSDSQLADILLACRHISTLLPEGAYDYESGCPVRPAALEQEEANKIDGGIEE
ncbi:MAG TPA: MarR family transcriptional regulator [Chloroflexia bacterium]|nr:MarR family transcriptional regulator [Chloroflexia bacterium]